MKNNLDSMGVKDALDLFPDQIRQSWTEAYSKDIPKFSPKAVVISGMGGSSNAAKILEGLYEQDSKIHIHIHNDYDLPFWVDKDILVIANSYSGNTEEVLSGVEAAEKMGVRVIGISTAGKINDVRVGTSTNPTGFPKTALGISFGSLAAVLSKIGVLKISERDLFSACDELLQIRKSWKPEDSAGWLHGYLPVLFGGRPLLGALNAGRNAMCEISRNFTQSYDFPEMNHVLIEATQKPEVAKKNRYMFFESNFNHERVKLRYKITKEIFDKQGLEYSDYQLKGTTKLVQALELAHYCAWIGYHLSVLDNADPGPEPWIIELKNRL